MIRYINVLYRDGTRETIDHINSLDFFGYRAMSDSAFKLMSEYRLAFRTNADIKKLYWSSRSCNGYKGVTPND